MTLPSSHPPPPQGATPLTARPKAEEPAAQFLNEARVRRAPLVFHLRSGQHITGTVMID